jgi:uncharacterized protein (TIGR03086 family)
VTDRAAAALIGGIALLERAVSYTLGCLNLVTPGSLRRPTPCEEWDVRALLVHMADSLDVLCDAVDVGIVSAGPAAGDGGTAPELVATIRERACRLLGAWAGASEPAAVSVYGHSLSNTIVASTGALEIAVHGWDLARGCGHDRAIPASLAWDLGELAPLVVTFEDRPLRFSYPVELTAGAGPSDRLVAFLGRDPASGRLAP